MKFGKRISAEAERQWRDFYVDYKACKRAIQTDAEAQDPFGRNFEAVIRQELEKVSAFYREQEAELNRCQDTRLQEAMDALGEAPEPADVAAFISRVKDLRKYAVLNYICVVKASKKRNRHLQAACGEQAVGVRATHILSQQYFFTSSQLASIATHAEILSKALQPVSASMLQDYQCPICLATLRGAVVLTCAHRFCWGCLVAHCTTTLDRTARSQEGGAGELASREALGASGEDWGTGKGEKAAAEGETVVVSSGLGAVRGAVVWEGEHSDEEQTVATFDCPVCRKAQLLDLDRLHVDTHLDSFVRRLELQGQQQEQPSLAGGTVTVLEDATMEESPPSEQLPSPMAVDASLQTATPAQRLGSGKPPRSSEVALLSVRDMDAVVEYLHEEQRQLQAQQAQQEDGKHAQQAEHAAPRESTQPLTIRSKAQQAGRAGKAEAQDDMEVDAAHAVHDGPAVDVGALCGSPPTAGILLAAASQKTAAARPAQPLPFPPRSPFSPATAPAVPALAAPGDAKGLRPAPHAVHAVSSRTEAQQPEIAPVAGDHSPAAAGEPPLLPPQRPEHKGRLTVCLDLDGTLVTTFTPKRAPLLPSTAVSYVVGRGGKLNPGGVFVVERPGLKEFFRRIQPVAEVVLFTAGLEDYAAPICDALEAKYNCFLHRLYRPACVPDEVYPCVKDMSRLGRDLSRCVLVDDTPLAFFRQPDNGIPVLCFRGDVDDQLLTDAVAPLIESLAGVPDVRMPLARRFNMYKWFQAQGLMVVKAPAPLHRAPSLPVLPRRAAAAPSPPRPHQAPHTHPQAAKSSVAQHAQQPQGILLVCDFDKTLLDYDAGERVCNELAPELTSLLSSLEMAANFVPVTNTVLAEMQRRGVSRDALLTTLRNMGREMPAASVQMLQGRWCAVRAEHAEVAWRAVGEPERLDVRVLSDCNSVFIRHVLAGAKVDSCVREVVTNLATFQRVNTGRGGSGGGRQQGQQAPWPVLGQPAAGGGAAGAGVGSGGKDGAGWLARMFGGRGAQEGAAGGGGRKPASQRLVITPRHPHHLGSHGCPLCPANLCKGQELEAMLEAARAGGGAAGPSRRRVVYCGDGANDLCPALCLGPHDVVLARKGFQLDQLIQQRQAAPHSGPSVQAQVRVWASHLELWQMVREAAGSR